MSYEPGEFDSLDAALAEWRDRPRDVVPRARADVSATLAELAALDGQEVPVTWSEVITDPATGLPTGITTRTENITVTKPVTARE